MDADDIAEFNTQKAEVLRNLSPCTVVFDHASAQQITVAFGEVSGDAALHASGQAMTHLRTGVLYFPLFGPPVANPTTSSPQNPPDFPPRAGQAFRILASRDQTLIGSRWQLDSYATAAPEQTIKFACHRLQA